jgi:hypothetical protein
LSPTLTPETICHKVVNSQLTKIAATELLISLLEESNNDEIRAKCIDAFSKLGIKTQKIFRIIENCLLSDTSALVRRTAIRVLVQDFPKKDNYLLLKWAVNHENSVLGVKQLLDLFNAIDDPHFNLFKKALLKKLEDVYNIIADEIDLILNLAILYIEFSRDFQLDIYSSWFKIMEFVKRYPDNVGLLPRLTYLRSGGHKLKPLSKTTFSLSELRKIYLKGNEISSLPNFWDRIKVIKKL